jgi:hypothetical protein
MAYENYSFVSWSSATPITGERLAQMSTNIDQVKDATDDKPQGVIKFKTVTTSPGSWTDFTDHSIITLSDESGTGGADNRVTVSSNRFYRATINFTGFVIDAKGAEDATYMIKICSGTFGGANTILQQYKFTPPPFTFIDVATLGNSATIANHTLKNNAYDTRFASGMHSIVLQSNSAGFTNQSFFVSVKRDQGASANNAPAYSIPASVGNELQFYIEDIGGTI